MPAFIVFGMGHCSGAGLHEGQAEAERQAPPPSGRLEPRATATHTATLNRGSP